MRSLIWVVGGLLLCAAIAHAQTRDALIDLSLDAEPGSWLVGLATGYSSNFHTGGFRAVPGRDDVPVLEEGRGGGFQVGLVAEYLVSRYFTLDGRIVYDVRPGHFERTWPDTLILVGSGERRPAFGLVVGTGIDQWVERTDGTGTRSYSAADRSIAAPNDVRLAIKAGAGFEWHASDRLWVNARTVYELGITDVSKAENWQLDALVFQLDMLIPL